jgi:ABC-type transporter Mla subunit MlaD
MSNEEFEKMMEFILGQQAQFAANIQGHDERLARLEGTVGQLEDIVNRLAAATLAGFKDVNAKLDALVDSHIRLSDAQARMNEALARLAEAQAKTEENQALTDEALRKLIATVERHISEGRGRTDGQK